MCVNSSYPVTAKHYSWCRWTKAYLTAHLLKDVWIVSSWAIINQSTIDVCTGYRVNVELIQQSLRGA